MRENGNERGLTHVSALAAHIGARDDEHAARIVEAQIIGNERLATGALHHGMASLIDEQHGMLHQLRLGTVERRGAFGKAGEYVQLCDRRGALLQSRQPCRQQFQQRVVQFLLARQGAVAGPQHLVLERLQLGRDEPLGGFDGLPPQIFRRNAVGLAAVHLDEESLHPIESQLQAGETGALALPAFEIQEKLLGVAAQQAQLVEFRIVSRCDHAAVAQKMRRRFDDGACQHGVFCAVIAQFGDELLQQRRWGLIQRCAQRLLQAR